MVKSKRSLTLLNYCSLLAKKKQNKTKLRLRNLDILPLITCSSYREMAEFLWTFAAQEVLKKVLKVAAEEIGVGWGMHKELSKLRKWLLKSEAILKDINTKKLHHESVKMWVEDLQHIVYEADDLLDELVYEDIRQQVETEETKKVRSFFSSSNNPFLFRMKMAKRMKDIIKSLHKHYCEASPLGLVGLVGGDSIETHKNIIDLRQIRETTSNFNFEEIIIGREDDVSNMVKLVIDSSYEHPMSIIPIVGMGGLGKTTLAKMVFNHELVKAHFNETIWVCVSESFSIINILEGIFQSLTKTSSGLNKENLLQRLQQEMEQKNYFLVLDDVWNEDARLWGELKECLKNIAGKSGSSIIVTTRSSEVGTIMGTTSSYRLKKFPNDQCWSLFKESANANRLVMNTELENIREELVTKIGGLPLVAKVLGGAVVFEGDYERWMTKIKSVVKNISTDENDFVLSTLKLSVDSLPFPSLKQCFAYCSNFPKDYLFDKESLIQMWVAQGFVQPQKEKNKMMEDIGEGYLDFLLSRSLFEVDYDMNGRITHLTMHDLMHNIACAISNHQQKVESSLSNSCEKTVRKLHTLICNNEKIHERIEDYAFLRVLKVSSIYAGNIFDEIGMLKHLRYLDITNCTELIDLECITKFYNLQTLKLGATTPLPKNLRKLIRLRHLHFNYIVSWKMSSHMSQLVHLQTLSAFKASCKKGCKIEELGPLRNLKGSLKLLNLEEVKDKEEARGARLSEKKNLIELGFYWNFSFEEDGNYNGYEVLEGLQPHQNLQSLSITHYPGKSFPNIIFVGKLVKICLVKCGKCEMLPMLGQLPKLEELDICYMNSVRSIGREFHGDKASFPKLKEFSLRFMENLDEWKDVSNDIDAFPRLEVLSLIACYKLRSVPHHFVSLQTLIAESCKELTKLPNQIECCDSIRYSLIVFDCPKLPRHMYIWLQFLEENEN